MSVIVKNQACLPCQTAMSVMVEYQAILASMTLVDEHDACCPPRAGSESFDQADQLIAGVL